MTRPARRALAAAGLVAAVTTIAYLPCLQNGFVDWDDTTVIVRNPLLQLGFTDAVVRALTQIHDAYWLPLTSLSFWADHRLWGLDPYGFHLTNLVLHALCAAWVALLALRVFSLARPEVPEASWAVPSAIAALLWSLHPLRVESVAWATERKDVLSAALGLPAVLLYLSWAARRRAAPVPLPQALRDRTYLAALALSALALLAKPAFVVLPAVFLVLDLFPLRRARPGTFVALLVEKAPWLALALADGVVTVLAQRPALMPLDEASPSARALLAFHSIVEYARLMAWPEGLMPYYLHPGNAPSLADPTYLGPLALVLSLTAGAVVLARRWPGVLAAWGLFLVPLAPVLGLVQAGGQRIADRFTYLPAIAPSLAVAYLLFRAADRLGRVGRVVAGLAAAAAIGALASVTLGLEPIWRDSGALWTRVIEVTPGQSGKAYFFRAMHLLQQGDAAGALADVSRSLVISQEKRYRRTFEVRALRAQALAALGRWAEAADEYERAISEKPAADPADYNQALAQARLRACASRQGPCPPGAPGAEEQP